MSKLSFSGHESFVCKLLWLKKGYDYINQYTFSSEDAVFRLGVGKNMVNSIHFWMQAFGLLEDRNQISDLAKAIFEDSSDIPEQGFDPFLEDIGTLWLLHYKLIATNKASIFNIFFNTFLPKNPEFTRDLLQHSLSNKAKQELGSISEKTLEKDVNVFLRTYLQPSSRDKEIEDSFSGILLDLGLLQTYKKENLEGKLEDWYRVKNCAYFDLPAQILLYCILDWKERKQLGQNVSIRQLLTDDESSPGLAFVLNEDVLIKKIEELTKIRSDIFFSDTAGVQNLHLPSVEPKTVLYDYYKLSRT